MRPTPEQIGLFKKYRGEEDAFSRVGSPAEKETMRDVCWNRVSELIQSLSLVKRKVASTTLREEIMREVREACHDQCAIDALMELAT